MYVLVINRHITAWAHVRAPSYVRVPGDFRVKPARRLQYISSLLPNMYKFTSCASFVLLLLLRSMRSIIGYMYE